MTQTIITTIGKLMIDDRTIEDLYIPCLNLIMNTKDKTYKNN